MLVDALHNLVELGAVSAILPSRTARRSNSIRLLQITDPRPTRAAGMVWRRTHQRSAAAAAVAAEVETALSAKR